MERKRYARTICLLATLLLCGAVVSYAPPATGEAQRRAAYAREGMVASAEAHASEIGAAVLREGGNAVDAAIAVGLALAVTYPQAGNIGGGGFMVIRRANGESVTIDFREMAPAAATGDMYLDEDGNVVPGRSTVGYLAAGVPGTVAGFALARERFGSTAWRELVEPARALADEGFPVSHRLAQGLRSNALRRFPESRRIFQRDGNYYEPGETFRQPELAETLRRIRDRGPREFYEGETARLIAADMAANDGLITAEDLRNYRPALRQPVRGTYRGYEIITMPPPSSGGVALIQMLNILEEFDLRETGARSSQAYHLTVEAMRRAFADRAHFMGDPDFVEIPVPGLIGKEYAATLAGQIDLARASRSEDVRHGNPPGGEALETTHYSVVDKDGTAVAVTYTINGSWGAGATVKGAGFLLNNEMDDFTSKPGVPNMFGLIQGEANAIEPGKRPLSSMTPTIVAREGEPYLVLGSPGGPTIINSVLQVILNVIDHGMTLPEAVAAPRIHHQWLPDEIRWEPYGIPPDMLRAMQERGHNFQERPAYMGDVQAIMVDPEGGWRIGVSDHRSPDSSSVGH